MGWQPSKSRVSMNHRKTKPQQQTNLKTLCVYHVALACSLTGIIAHTLVGCPQRVFFFTKGSLI